MADQTQIEASKIFVWGQIGEELKKLDKDRMLCLAQKNPHYALSVKANQELAVIIEEILNAETDSDGRISAEAKKKIMDMVENHNDLDTIFRQINRYFQTYPDILSTGSMIMGETEQKKAWLKTDYGGNE